MIPLQYEGLHAYSLLWMYHFFIMPFYIFKFCINNINIVVKNKNKHRKPHQSKRNTKTEKSDTCSIVYFTTVLQHPYLPWMVFLKKKKGCQEAKRQVDHWLNVTKYIYSTTSLMYNFKVCDYSHCLLPYTSIPLHFGGKYCTSLLHYIYLITQVSKCTIHITYL